MSGINYESVGKNMRYLHVRREKPASNFSVDFHLHTGCEVFILLSGDVHYFVEKKIYPLKYGDIIITNNHEIHKPSFQSDKLYERLTLEFTPDIVRAFSSPNFDLLRCFYNRPHGERNKATLNARQLEEVLHLFTKIEALTHTPLEGNEILQLNYLIELLVYINRLFLKTVPEENPVTIPKKLLPILNYIDQNPESDLSLAFLEKNFYIDRYYLCKLFKQSIGSTIHNYIIYKRISRAKKLLSQGVSVTDACGMCGFTDYSNFIKMFKRTVGTSPGKYKGRV